MLHFKVLLPGASYAGTVCDQEEFTSPLTVTDYLQQTLSVFHFEKLFFYIPVGEGITRTLPRESECWH